MERIYLSERNLRSLLNKIERFKQGDTTQCTIIKYANPLDPYCQTVEAIEVVAIPDDRYYTARKGGKMHPLDDPGYTIHT
jgi:hypothetical protein